MCLAALVRAFNVCVPWQSDIILGVRRDAAPVILCTLQDMAEHQGGFLCGLCVVTELTHISQLSVGRSGLLKISARFAEAQHLVVLDYLLVCTQLKMWVSCLFLMSEHTRNI